MRILKPDLSGDAFLRRHQNPVGLGLRVLTYLVLFAGLWTHSIWLVGVALVAEAVNWLYMRETKSPPKFVRRVIETELAFLNLPNRALKYGLSLVFLLGAATLCAGLWQHSPKTILAGFILMGLFGIGMRVVVRH